MYIVRRWTTGSLNRPREKRSRHQQPILFLPKLQAQCLQHILHHPHSLVSGTKIHAAAALSASRYFLISPRYAPVFCRADDIVVLLCCSYDVLEPSKRQEQSQGTTQASTSGAVRMSGGSMQQGGSRKMTQGSRKEDEMPYVAQNRFANAKVRKQIIQQIRCHALHSGTPG